MSIRTRTPEGDVLLVVLAALRAFGIDARRQNTGAARFDDGRGGSRLVRFGERGNPDVTGTLPGGRRLDLEVKAPGKRPTPEQLDRLRRTNAAGGVGLWVDDAAQMPRILGRLLDGWRVEIDDDGLPWLVSPDEVPSRKT